MKLDFDYQGMVILGASGNIGTRLIERVTESDYPEGEHFENPELPAGKNPIPHAHPTRIIAVADSTHFYFEAGGIKADVLRASDNTRDNVKALLADKGIPHHGDLTLIPKAIAESQNGPALEAQVGYVDLTDSIDAQALYQHVITQTNSALVAVSKEVLGNASKAEFDALVGSGRLEYLPTVGAGMDALAHCANYPESRESLRSIAAMISGTNLAICRGLESEAYARGERELSDLVQQAWQDGDTEPYAHKDIGEAKTDTWNKARILAMTAGLEALPENIKAGMPFVPQSIGEQFNKATMTDYIQAIRDQVDAKMRAFVKAHINNTHTLRHLARIEVAEDGTETISVGLEQVERDSEFARSAQNVVIIEDSTETVILKKPGAGRDVTAKSIEQAFRNLVPRGLPRFKGDA